MLTDIDVAHFRAFGFVVLRQCFDPGPLSAELDRALRSEFRSSFRADVGGGGIEGRYLPMMCAETPVSLSLLDSFAEPAARLLGARVLPVRAKGVLYFGATRWHNDTSHDVSSIGVACYLETLRAENGALHVIPGSHRGELAEAVKGYAALRAGRSAEASANASDQQWLTALPAYPVQTRPGDAIAFDEHLYHASAGGSDRRQWRVDYIADPVGAPQEAKVRAYYAGLYLPDWDGGYDVDRYPSYGRHWRASGRPWVERLEQLGVYDLASAEEAFARARAGERGQPRRGAGDDR
jgi:hypothetical protein